MILGEADGVIAMMLGIISSQRFFEVFFCFAEFALAQIRQAKIASRNRYLCRATFPLRVVQKGFRGLSRECQFATQQAADPQAIIGCESFGGIANSSSEFLGADKSG